MFCVKFIARKFFCAVLLTITSAAWGQKPPSSVSGVYLTEADFQSGMLSYPTVAPGDTLIETTTGAIRLIHHHEPIQLEHGTFFGYRHRGLKNISFGRRGFFQEYGFFQVLDTTGLIVYMQRIPSMKYRFRENPYFSLRWGDPKYPLTVHQLKKQLHVSRAVIRDLRWVDRNSSLTMRIKNRTLVNSLLYPSPQLQPEPPMPGGNDSTINQTPWRLLL